MAVIEIDSEQDAVALLRQIAAGGFADSEDSTVELGEWANPRIYIPRGNAEITAPFMTAFVEVQNAVYRIAAEVKYGTPDLRKLTESDKEKYRISVQVTEGSSNFLVAIADVLERIGKDALGKLTGNQVFALIAGGAVLLAGVSVTGTYLENRKTERIAEIESGERMRALEALEFANREQAATTREVIGLMRGMGSAHSVAVDASETANEAMLRAAASESEVSINGFHLTGDEARELRLNARRPVSQSYIEREFRVTQIDTSNPADTRVVVQEVGSGATYPLSFADRLIQERDLGSMYVALRSRGSIWLRLEVRRVGDDVRSAEIRAVISAPT